MYDPTLHLFIDDYHICNLFALQRVYGVLEKHPLPVPADIPGRQVAWGGVIYELRLAGSTPCSGAWSNNPKLLAGAPPKLWLRRGGALGPSRTVRTHA